MNALWYERTMRSYHKYMKKKYDGSQKCDAKQKMRATKVCGVLIS